MTLRGIRRLLLAVLGWVSHGSGHPQPHPPHPKPPSEVPTYGYLEEAAVGGIALFALALLMMLRRP